MLKYYPDWLKGDDTPPQESHAGRQSQDALRQKHCKRSSQKKISDSGKGKPFKAVAPHNREPEVSADGPV